MDESGRWAEHEVFDVLADLEAQAETVHHWARLAEVDDRSRAEYHEVTLDARLMASTGLPVVLAVRGAGHVRGRLVGVGEGWCRLEDDRRAWVVRTPAVTTAQGLSSRAVPRVAWSRLDAVGLRAPLRRLADAAARCDLVLADGSAVAGRVARVGADFVEVEQSSSPGAETRHVLVALDALAVVRHEL
ncbi:hypothetical protein IEQ44_02245 [Nocardioides sp. Y6]|uniref:Uncharacterized protein n=1 Tax=Nocardioides malaquae TaxID=2773426 RepID=A0ABR9RPH4_9ACTN|nr:hypothetical protein [Nocardioides malaquae]MBE7323473.1 hypothetical protein [Nocardioides malaquae]